MNIILSVIFTLCQINLVTLQSVYQQYYEYPEEYYNEITFEDYYEYYLQNNSSKTNDLLEKESRKNEYVPFNSLTFRYGINLST